MPKFNIQMEDYEIQKKEPAAKKEKAEPAGDKAAKAKTDSVNASKQAAPKAEKKPAKAEDSKKEPKAIVFKQKVREKKSVHKSFLITESMNQKFSKLAKMNGYNENEFFIEILNQLFESYQDDLDK